MGSFWVLASKLPIFFKKQQHLALCSDHIDNQLNNTENNMSKYDNKIMQGDMKNLKYFCRVLC